MVPLLKLFSERAVDTHRRVERRHVVGDVVEMQLDIQSWKKIALPLGDCKPWRTHIGAREP